LSQLTLIALILLVAFLWKFGPWFRQQRILSYDFPIGWWHHVELIDPNHSHWPVLKRKKLEAYVRLFIDQVEFIAAPSLNPELEIKHRVAIATQFFLVVQNIQPNPFKGLERIYLQNSQAESNETNGLITLFWEDKKHNFKAIMDASQMGSMLSNEDKEFMNDYLTGKTISDKEIAQRLERVLG